MNSRRVAVRAVILHEGKVLCVKLKPYRGKATGDAVNYWCTPGGGVDLGEPLIPALEREVIEELGVRPKVGKLLYIQQFSYNDMEQLEFFFEVTNGQDYLNIDLEKTTHGALEIAEVAFINPQNETVLPEFFTQRDVAADARRGITQVFNYIPG
ncbi:MAG TPA: NUDIX domain-containing protein [Candidatus Saccharimonadales bacterium]|nr:NUDIX domain-containing protein [Candidatus Saccharimonadales bacterium]